MEGVFMSEELEDKVELEDKKGPVEPAHHFFAVLTRNEKRSKKLRVGRYQECVENTTVVRKLELFLTHEEFSSVVGARSRPTGFALYLDDQPLLSVSDKQVRVSVESVGTPDSLVHVWLTF